MKLLLAGLSVVSAFQAPVVLRSSAPSRATPIIARDCIFDGDPCEPR